jgi:hypothetical protein
MAKELTHILIAQNVLERLRDRQPLLAGVLESHAPAYYLGAIFPDALFYDLPPFRLKPKKYIWVSKVLHDQDVAKNDQMAIGLFRSISDAPEMWPQKAAFSAGIITHTAADHIFHNLIGYYNKVWNEQGAEAMATHREMETFIDMVLLERRNMHPRKFPVAHYIALDGETTTPLYRFYLSYVTGNDRGANHTLVNVVKRAIGQQRFFMRLFAARPAYQITRIADRVVSNHLRLWHALFYPHTEGLQGFRFPARMPAGHENPFDPDGLTRYTDAAVSRAVHCINLALKSLT